MLAIVYDILIPHSEVPALKARFEKLGQLLIDDKKLTVADLIVNSEPAVEAEVIEQLHQIYRDQHDGEELEGAQVHRLAIDIDGVAGSVNEIAMTYARLMTPPADLPADAYKLEFEDLYEVPDRYPWTVEINR